MMTSLLVVGFEFPHFENILFAPICTNDEMVKVSLCARAIISTRCLWRHCIVAILILVVGHFPVVVVVVHVILGIAGLVLGNLFAILGGRPRSLLLLFFVYWA